jgi:hypothetical protein
MPLSLMTLNAEWHIFTDLLEVFMLSDVATLQSPFYNYNLGLFL